MPNYVYNRLTVISKVPAEVQQFYKDNKIIANSHHEEVALSFSNLVPENPANDCGSSWRISNWGCKWDASDSICIHSETKLEYAFSTPWSPPSAWLTTVSIVYPTLTFYLRYEDEAFDFFALAKVCNGTTEYLENYKIDDVVTYLTRNHNVYPEDLLKLAELAGLTQDVCLGTTRLDYEKYEKVVEDFLSTIKSQYQFNASCMLFVLERLLTSKIALFDA